MNLGKLGSKIGGMVKNGTMGLWPNAASMMGKITPIVRGTKLDKANPSMTMANAVIKNRKIK